MTIATLNIDWANKQKSKTHIDKLVEQLVKTDADILIITECVDSLKLPNYNYAYKTNSIPINAAYEEFDYLKYLKGEYPVRTAIFSKFKSIRSFDVTDDYTSICHEFETSKGLLTIYATIIGTQFTKSPYAQNELNNCVSDCKRIALLTENLCLVGDLNTSFSIEEEYHEMRGIKSRRILTDLCEHCNMDLTTGNIDENIDHILTPKKMELQFKEPARVFVEKGTLSDHMGIMIEIN